MLGTVVEVADLALDAYELSHRRNKTNNPDHCTQLQAALDNERLENHRLRATLDEYETIIHQINALSKETPDSQMPHYESCPSDLYEQLVKTLESPTFLEKLQALRQNIKKEDTASVEFEGDIMVNSNPDDPSWWVWVTKDTVPNKREEQCTLDDENYIIITEEDIVEGIALFMARIVVNNPNSKSLTPEQLRKTISGAFANMHRTNAIRKLWDAGKVIYTIASCGLTLYGLYTQRHIIKAATKVVVKSGKFIVKAL